MIRYQLIGYITVILSCHAFTDSRLHKTGKRWQDINWWVNLTVVKLTINENLTFGNVTSQIGNGVSDIYNKVEVPL